jgi:hypothetical protein
MAEQLELIERTKSVFHIDSHTREIGLQVVAEARRVLAEVMRAAADREAQKAA